MRGVHPDYAVHNMPHTWAAGRNGSHGEGITAMIRSKSSMGRLFVYSLVAAFVLLMMMGCGEDSASQNETTKSNGTEQDSTTGPSSPNTGRTGEELFRANCSVCHGVDAFGTNQGPPLVDKTYHPGHHPDFSIRNAISKGVRQHHWFFGDMPPVAGVSPDDAEKIICHIRDTQLANGLFEADEYETTC